ncbi:MAG: 23S rRNA (adenine(2030)-N(6))-methyltransferase RlmJ [Stappiaceae bacterium]
MNYRHAYHAGNIGDVLKHIVLSLIIEHLKLKPTSFRIIDTHAGIGVYDLTSEEAHKTEEWHNGVGKLYPTTFPDEIEVLIAPWRQVIESLNPGGVLNNYPGSPFVSAHLMRPGDRLLALELHPEDHAKLTKRFSRDKRVKAIHLDGWLALKSFLPPKENRGLVLIDPPFEETDEFGRLAEALRIGTKRWTNGIFAFWYPIKNTRESEAFYDALKETGIKKALKLELATGKPHATGTMRASGMIIVNPPWQLKSQMELLLPFLADQLSTGQDSFHQVEWLIEE